MKMTVEERFRKRLLKIGKKNSVLKYLVLPVLFVGTFFLHVISYLGSNSKRLAMLVLVPCLCVVYSSFSFPAFITVSGMYSMTEDESAEGVSLATEVALDLSELELLEEEELLADLQLPDYETPHGLDGVDKYDADEILEYVQEQGKNLQEEEAVQKNSTEYENYEFSKDDWRLLLINKEHSIPDDYTFNLGVISGTNGSMKCDERIIDDLMKMLQAAKEDDISLVICSPYRDMDRQEMLFNRKIARYMNKGLSYMEAYRMASQMVMVPGASEHQLGLALDIVTGSYVTLNEGFADTDAGKWLAENSCRFGFILRYPKGKEYITGVGYEPWHFRYVGVEAATAITDKNITLEEFWEDL